MSSNLGEASYKINITNGILLYYHHYSYYSQKVVMALHEKNLPFESHIVDIIKGAQYEPWFLQLNPRGEVPVLQDTGKIIPDSGRIIDYLEDNFSNGDTPRLIPMDQGPEIRQKVTLFRNMIDQIPSGIITMGSFFHPEFVENPKAPFLAPIRKMLMNAEKNSSQKLREYAEKNPESKQILLQKAEFQDKKHKSLLNKDEFSSVLKEVDNLLTAVEEELDKHNENGNNDWWLCSSKFTVADVSLTILLERLNQLGFEKHFWLNNKRPHIEKYYQRVKQRNSYKKTIPSTLKHIQMLMMYQKPLFIGLGVLTAVSIIIGGYYLIKSIL